MRRLLLIPKRLHPSRYDWLNLCGEKCIDYQCLYEMMRDKLGFEIIYTDIVGNFPRDTEFVLCIFRRPMILRGTIHPQVKLIITVGDVHGSHKDWARRNLAVFKRANIILSPTDDAFRHSLAQYVHKYRFFPQFFRTHERFVGLGFNENPKVKCLVVGRMERGLYPLRAKLREALWSGMDNGKWQTKLDVLKHFWYDRGRTEVYPWERPPAAGDDYAKILHEYFCCTAFSGTEDYMVGKCLEIPAAGSLLITNEVPDMKTAGFVPMKHYVPVTKPMLFSQIEDCLMHPEKYDQIRRCGTKFVRVNHSINNRFQQFEKILEKI